MSKMWTLPSGNPQLSEGGKTNSEPAKIKSRTGEYYPGTQKQKEFIPAARSIISPANTD